VSKLAQELNHSLAKMMVLVPRLWAVTWVINNDASGRQEQV
jgi:hypothetical protein